MLAARALAATFADFFTGSMDGADRFPGKSPIPGDTGVRMAEILDLCRIQLSLYKVARVDTGITDSLNLQKRIVLRKTKQNKSVKFSSSRSVFQR